ncbi:MAG: sulfite exporter TauE/SafE family protein [Pseudomonadota bacterium]
MITDPVFYALAVPAILLVGISKGGFGGGLAMLAVPMLSLAIDPITAAAIMLPILCAMDVVGLWAYRKTWDGAILKLIVPAAIVGIVLGALTFRYMSAPLIQIIIGLISVLFTLDYVRKRMGGNPEPRSPSTISGGFWSAVSGFTSFVAHAGSPPLSIYLLPLRLNKTIYVGTTVIFYAVVNYVKLIPYGLLGQFSGANLTSSLILLPLAPLGTYLGVRLHHKISEPLFYGICYVALFVIGVRLIYVGVAAYL